MDMQDSRDALRIKGTRKGFWRRSRIPFLIASLMGALGLGVLTVGPEYILFRDRLVFSIFDLGTEFVLQPFDQRTHDGLTLRSWYKPPQDDKVTIVYFAGRDGDVIRKPRHLFDLAEQGYGLMLAGYRGYGGNPGRPSEEKLYRDATALLEKLAENRLAPDGIVLYGYSMGTGIASYIAARTKPVGVVLEAPFTSFRDVVGQTARSMPLWLVRTRFDTRSRFASIDAPVLLLAGERDTVTPPAFAEMLAKLNESLAMLHIFPGAAHDDRFEHGAWDAVATFLEGLQNAALPAVMAADPASLD